MPFSAPDTSGHQNRQIIDQTNQAPLPRPHVSQKPLVVMSDSGLQ